ncbi:MAG: tyrosine-protein kinase [Frankiales bacterium]|nr:tyrosine-protein kinase [Frankiales bacterium]
MDLRDYLRVLRTRWRLIALCTLVAIGAAAAYSTQQTPLYRASTQLFVAGASADISGALTGQQFSQQRVQSYAQIVNSPAVVDPVVKELGLSLTPGQVAAEISADVPPNTVLLNIHVTDTQPARAQAIANAVSQRFATLAAQLETLGKNTPPVHVSVVKPAGLSTTPISPKTNRNLVLGAILGLLLGVAVAALRDTLDTTVKHLDDLTKEVAVPALGVVLFDPDAVKRPLIVDAAAQSTRAEAFRQLRTNLQFVDVDSAPHSIVITSSVPEEGKTTTTANLAISLAQAGVRVCLVEGDLRRPRLMHYLGLEGAVGLTSVLIGRAKLDDVLQPWGDGKLQVMGCGPTPPNPSELLGARTMAQTLKELEDRFDLVIVDAPPLLPVTDAAVLASLCSGAIIVVRHGKTKREQVRRAVEALRSVDTAIYGLVLNMAPSKGPDAYYYGYAYRYDYKPTQPVDLRPAGPRGRKAGESEGFTPLSDEAPQRAAATQLPEVTIGSGGSEGERPAYWQRATPGDPRQG